MTTHEYESPWQVMPAKIIKLALEHAEKKDDFDHQVAYLLLDIGVEAALKAYLVNQGHNVEKIFFPDLLKKVKEELSKTTSDLISQINDIGYFHGIRNKLYHQGDGVKPTEDNLKRYSALAKRVVEEVIEVNLETEEKKYVVNVEGRRHEVEDLADHIETKFKNFRESCAIVIEKAHPAYATREFAMKLNYILVHWMDIDDADPEDRIENRKHRLEKFNELTGTKQTSYNFVDYVSDDVNHFYVLIALQQISEKWQDDWGEYTELDDKRSELLRNWKFGMQSGRLTDEQIREEFEKITNWIAFQQKKIDEWIHSHLENVYRRLPSLSSFERKGSVF